MRSIIALLLISFSANGNPVVDLLNKKAINTLFSNADSSMIYVDSAYSISVNDKYDYGRAKAMVIKGRLLDLDGKYLKAITWYRESIKTFLKADTTDLSNEMTAYRNIARIQAIFNQYDLAATYYDSSIMTLQRYINIYPEYAAERGHDVLDFYLPYYKSMTLRKGGEIAESMNVLLKLENKFDQREHPNFIAITRNWLGVIFNEDLKDYAKSREYFFQVINHPDVKNEYKAWALNNAGLSYRLEGNYKEAIEILSKISSLTGLSNEIKFEVGVILGETYLASGQPEKAIEVMTTATALDFDISNNLENYKIHASLKEAYTQIGDLSLALHHLQKYTDYNNAHNAAAKIQIEENQAETFRNYWHTLEKTEKDVIERNRMIGFILIVLSATVLISLLCIWFYRRNKKRSNLVRSIQNKANEKFQEFT